MLRKSKPMKVFDAKIPLIVEHKGIALRYGTACRLNINTGDVSHNTIEIHARILNQ